MHVEVCLFAVGSINVSIEMEFDIGVRHDIELGVVGRCSLNLKKRGFTSPVNY